jgi:hypothetical protein
MVEFGISCVGIFPTSWSRFAATVKNVFGDSRFPGGWGVVGALPLKFSVENDPKN